MNKRLRVGRMRPRPCWMRRGTGLVGPWAAVNFVQGVNVAGDQSAASLARNRRQGAARVGQSEAASSNGQPAGASALCELHDAVADR